MTSTSKTSLKTLVALDAATCAAMAGLLLLGSGPIGSLTNIPPDLLFWAGACLVPIAVFMIATASRSLTPHWATSLIVLGNVLWVAASILLLAGGLVAPNALGWAFVTGQAAIVALLAKLEFDAARGQGGWMTLEPYR